LEPLRIHRYRKPGILFGLSCRTVDVAAYTYAQHDTMLVVNDNSELRRTIDLLRARKVFRETHELLVTVAKAAGSGAFSKRSRRIFQPECFRCAI
jgi:hypothetical protein